MANPTNVLIVDDDRDHGAFLAEIVQDHGFATKSVGSAEEALAAFAEAPVEVVVTDVHMPGIDGVRLISMLANHASKPALIAITAFGSLNTAVRVLRAGAMDYLSKPFQPEEIVERIRQAVQRRTRQLEQQKLHQEVEEVLRKRRT
ncbi:MAG TPA: response regulator [Minicystis sp.]|nr:response regulator [Minicystis sp.]